MLTIFLLMLFIIIVAMIDEIKTYNINPYIWVIGGISGMVCNVIGLGIVSWIESVIAAIILLLIIVLYYSKLSKHLGGGILKGFLAIGILLGRYCLLAVINFIVVGTIYNIFRKKDSILGSGMIYGTPLLFISIVLIGGEYFLISHL